MNISMIAMLGLPVLYLTGSLRQTVGALKISGKAFAGYFLVAAALTLIPKITLFDSVIFNASGAFLCIAPFVYAVLHGGFGYRFLLACLLCVLLSVLAYYILSTYTLPYIGQLTSAAVAIVALLCLGRYAAPIAPVLAGIYGISEGIMGMLSGQANAFRLFDVTELATLCFVICFTASTMIIHGRRTCASEKTAPDIPDLPNTEFPEPEYPKPEFPEPKIPEPEFPGIEFPEPEYPEPKFPRPEVSEPVFPEVEFPKPEPIIAQRPRHNRG